MNQICVDREMAEEVKTEINTQEEIKIKPTSSDDEILLDKDQLRWRNKYKAAKQEAKQEMENLKAEQTSLVKNLQSEIEKISHSQKIEETRRVQSEVKAAALAAGLQDMEMVKLFDFSKITVKEDGEISGLDEEIDNLKTRKPNLFEKEKKLNSSLNISVEKDENHKKVNYLEMSNDEFRKSHSYKFY